MENRSNNFLVGSITLLLLFALAGFTVWLANTNGRQTVEYDIFFKQSVEGLNRGSAVVFKGVPAGQVSDIALWQPDPEFVRVRIEVDRNIPIRLGTTASISSVGFTGLSQIALQGSVAGAPPITDVGPAGRPVIPPTRGGLGELLNSAPQLLERLSTLTERLTELANDRNQESLANILDNIETVSGSLAQSSPQVDQTLAEARAAVRQAGVAAQEIGALAASTRGLVDNEGRPMVADLRRAVQSAERSIATLETAITDARPGLQQFSQRTIPEANALIRDLRRSATTLSNVADRLDQQGAGGIIAPRLPDYEPQN
jgi:phospholipid/cholesterol/gamma-HCH transport system substrate-binding protein